jgi:hypothetical protein
MDYIKLKGEKHPFWFALKAQREFSKAELGVDNMYLLWLGLKYGAMKEGKEFTMSEDDVLNIFEDDVSEYNDAGKVLLEQMGKLRGTEVGK